MIIRGHTVGESAHLVGNGIIGNVYQEVEIFTSDGLQDRSLCFAGSETGTLSFYKVRIRGGRKAGSEDSVPFLTPLSDVIVNNFSEIKAALQRDDAQISDRKGVPELFDILCHDKTSVNIKMLLLKLSTI